MGDLASAVALIARQDEHIQCITDDYAKALAQRDAAIAERDALAEALAHGKDVCTRLVDDARAEVHAAALREPSALDQLAAWYQRAYDNSDVGDGLSIIYTPWFDEHRRWGLNVEVHEADFEGATSDAAARAALATLATLKPTPDKDTDDG